MSNMRSNLPSNKTLGLLLQCLINPALNLQPTILSIQLLYQCHLAISAVYQRRLESRWSCQSVTTNNYMFSIHLAVNVYNSNILSVKSFGTKRFFSEGKFILPNRVSYACTTNPQQCYLSPSVTTVHVVSLSRA